MKIVVAVLLLLAVSVSFVLASQQEAERKLVMIRELKELLTEQEDALQAQSFVVFFHLKHILLRL